MCDPVTLKQPTWLKMNVEDEISLPGLVGAPDAAGTGPPSGGGPGISLAASIPAETELEIQSDDEEVSGCGFRIVTPPL